MWGIYYLQYATDNLWYHAFTISGENISDGSDPLEKAKEVGSLLKSELRAYAVRLIRDEEAPTLPRDQPRKKSGPSWDEERTAQAQFLSEALTGSNEWAPVILRNLQAWRSMPLYERMKYLPTNKTDATEEQKETHHV